MGLKLYLCEKPSQAKDIGAALGVLNGRKDGFFQVGDIAVTWAFGHLLAQAEPAAYGDEYAQFGNVEVLPIIPTQWKMSVPKDKNKQFNIIKTLLKQANEVIISTDADREGEVIGREILDFCGYRNKVSRLWAQALDPESVRKALASIMPGQQKESLYQAGLARTRADWLIGMNFSRAFTVAYSEGFGKEHTLSIGRIQTPTLALVVKRDASIDQFTSYPYYTVSVTYETTEKDIFEAVWQVPEHFKNNDGHLVDKNCAEQLAKTLAGGQGVINQATVERKKIPPPLPYSLSALQKEASMKLKITPKKVLEVAQALYEKYKLTTYPRSPCQYLPSSQKNDVPIIFEALKQLDASLGSLLSGADPLRNTRMWNDAQVSKHSHHAIIPTKLGTVNLNELSVLEKDIYIMIRNRYIAQFYPDYEYDAGNISVLQCEQVFKAIGNVPKIIGWKAILQLKDDSDADNKTLPSIQSGESVSAINQEVKSKKTNPPARFTEATLLDEMKTLNDFLKGVDDLAIKKILKDTEGLGTEATRADIIEKLLDMGYVTKQKGKIYAAEKGKKTIAQIPPIVADPITTAKWETALSAIEVGKVTLEQFMDIQTALVKELVEKAKTDALKRGRLLNYSGTPNTTITKHKENETCPKCKKGTLVKKSYKKDPTKFLISCSDYECKFFEWCQ